MSTATTTTTAAKTIGHLDVARIVRIIYGNRGRLNTVNQPAEIEAFVRKYHDAEIEDYVGLSVCTFPGPFRYVVIATKGE